MGWGKGGDDSTEIMTQLMQNMSTSQETTHLAEMPQQPQVIQTPTAIEMPEVVSPLEIDWAEKNEKLAALVQGQQAGLDARKKSQMDTVLSSPLADDDDVNVTQSLLTGK